jgi:hypothetical protein
MRADDPNYEYLLLIADALGELCNEVVFVGGCTAGLLLTDPAAEGIRVTKDVDAIVEAATLRQYYVLESRLPALGFARDANSDVICRWRHTASGVLFDLMPIDPAILGFSNRWYSEAARTAARVRLNDRVEIRRISAPAFVATKLEAFLDRGCGDFLSSHDLEDVLAVVDGRSSIVDELQTAPPDLRQFVRETIGALLSEARFANYLPGLLADNSRANIVMERLRGLSSGAPSS